MQCQTGWGERDLCYHDSYHREKEGIVNIISGHREFINRYPWGDTEAGGRRSRGERALTPG